MSDVKIEKGMVVKLKSGGLAMTVDGFEPNVRSGVLNYDRVRCVWFGTDDEPKKQTFSAESLTIAPTQKV